MFKDDDGFVRFAAQGAPRKHGQSNKYFVHDLLAAWPGFINEGVDLPPLLDGRGGPDENGRVA